ncbi:hypothetical protein V8C37DRAFT_402687 [Trichoderma ceciliae]
MPLNVFPWWQSDLRLDGLNPPVRQRIMTYLTLEELGRTIRASRVLLQEFRSNRRDLLLPALKNTLGPYILEAFAVNRTGNTSFQISRSNGKVTEFLKSFSQHREPGELIELCKLISEDDCVDMATFHNHVVQPLVQQYVRTASETLDNVNMTDYLWAAPISDVERARLHRGFYRFELACNFYGRVHTDVQKHGFSGVDILTDYLRLFEPWEIQEMFCVHMFVKITYQDVLDETGPVSGPGRKQALMEEDAEEGLITRGLYVLRLFDISKDEGQRFKELVRDHQVRRRGDFLDDAWGPETQRDLHHAETNGVILRANLPFRGDYIPYSSSEGRFPSGPWLTKTLGKDHQAVGCFFWPVLYETGYVFWDDYRFGAQTMLHYLKAYAKEPAIQRNISNTQVISITMRRASCTNPQAKPPTPTAAQW